jgi:DNA adenine methylase
MKSIIKYYGGKTYMTDIILQNFPTDYHIYVEGFGGGASVLFQKKQTPLEVYNDLGKNVYSLFKVISDKEKFERLKERLDLTFYSNSIREEFKELLKRNDLDIEDRAYYFFFVNRSSFNGVGGFSRTMLARRNMSKSVSDYLSAIDRLPEVHNRLSSVIIDNQDIFCLIEKYNSENVFLYLDPPYIHETRKSNTNYEEEMSNEQHEMLVNTLLEFKGKFLLSGYNHEIYTPLTKKFGRYDFRSTNSGSCATESLWKNY